MSPSQADDAPSLVAAPATQEVPETDNTTFSGVKVAAADHWDTSAQVVITTTESEVRNILHTHLDSMKSQDGWAAPLTVVIAIGVALVAGIKADFGRYLLVFGLGMAVLWLASALRRAWRCRGHEGIDAIIAELRPASARRAVEPKPATAPSDPDPPVARFFRKLGV